MYGVPVSIWDFKTSYQRCWEDTTLLALPCAAIKNKYKAIHNKKMLNVNIEPGITHFHNECKAVRSFHPSNLPDLDTIRTKE